MIKTEALMKKKECLTFTVVLAIISCGMPAIAELTFYTDRSDWEADVNGETVMEFFESDSVGLLVEGVNSAGLIDIELVNVSPENTYNRIFESERWSGWTPYFYGNLHPDDPDAMINLIFRSSVSAFGGDFGSTHSSDGLWLKINGEPFAFEDDQLLPSGDGSGFLGVISTESFSTVTFFDPVQDGRVGESFKLDNVSFVPVPEPVSFCFLGLGILCLRKRRKVKIVGVI